MPGARRRARPRRRWLAAVLALVLLTGLAVTGRVVTERPGAGTASTAAAAAATGPAAPVRPSPVVATIGTGGFSYDMVAGAGALWVVGSDEVTRVDPRTDRRDGQDPGRRDRLRPGRGGRGGRRGLGAGGRPRGPVGHRPRQQQGHGEDPARRPPPRVHLGERGRQHGLGRLLRGDERRLPRLERPAAAGRPPPQAGRRRHPPARQPGGHRRRRPGVWVATADGRVLLVSRKRNRVVTSIAAGGPLGFSQTIAAGAGGVWLADPVDEQVSASTRGPGG
jgi:hypothetical protein